VSKLQEKKQEFLAALNDALPRNIQAAYKEGQSMKDVLNVIIHSNGHILELYGLTETNNEVWWCKNTTGGFY
jgi:predicted Zn-dependent protease